MDDDSDNPDIDETIAGFAFGNVEKNGDLDNDSLSKKELKSLQNFSDITEVKSAKPPKVTDTTVIKPSENAIDFSDISETYNGELIEQTVSLHQKSKQKQPKTLPELRAQEYEKVFTKSAKNDPIEKALPELEESSPDFFKMFNDPKPYHTHNKWKHAQNRVRGRLPTESSTLNYSLPLSSKSTPITVDQKQENTEEILKNHQELIEKDDLYHLEHGTLDLNALTECYAEPPSPDHHFLQSYKSYSTNNRRNSVPQRLNVPPWRIGPNKLWYDLLGVEMDGTRNGKPFSYNFGLAKNKPPPPKGRGTPKLAREYIQAMTSGQSHPIERPLHEVYDWTQDIIYDTENMPQETLMQKRRREMRRKLAGWTPSEKNNIRSSGEKGQAISAAVNALAERDLTRTLPNESLKVPPEHKKYVDFIEKRNVAHVRDATRRYPQSMFEPVDWDLCYGNQWMKKIIWDVDYMDYELYPEEFLVDPNDPTLILNVPTEPEDEESEDDEPDMPSLKERKKETAKVTAKILKEVGFYAADTVEDDDSEPEQEIELDPWNFSNDAYYNPVKKKASQTDEKGLLNLQHSIPAVQLNPVCMPTYLTPQELRNWHRPKLRPNWDPKVNPHPEKALEAWEFGRRRTNRPEHCLMDFMICSSLTRHLKEVERKRQQERLATGGGDVFFMRTLDDLSVKDGGLLHFEYCEEYPPLVSQAGMAALLRYFYRKDPSEDKPAPQPKLGERALISTNKNPFLGIIPQGETLYAIENRLFRAPCYQQELPQTDFMIIRTRTSYYIRKLKNSFAVGQICPLTEVPGPNSKKATVHIRDFLMVYIIRLFLSKM